MGNTHLTHFPALKDVSERIGGSAIFKYKLPNEGAPMEWIHNGKRIFPEKDPQKYEIIKDGLNRTLVIKNLKEQEQGSISVKIADKTSTAKLKVQGLCSTKSLNVAFLSKTASPVRVLYVRFKIMITHKSF